GCLGILLPPSVLLIVYGATAGVSVVKLYAGAMFPGLLLTVLYAGYVILLAKLKPYLAPPLPAEERRVTLPAHAATVSRSFGHKALPALLRAIKGRHAADVPLRTLLSQLGIALMPALAFALIMGFSYHITTKPAEILVDTSAMSFDIGDTDNQD